MSEGPVEFVSSCIQFVLNAMNATSSGVPSGSNPLAAALPNFAEICAAQMAQVEDTTSPTTASPDNPNAPAASATQLAASVPVPLASGKAPRNSATNLQLPPSIVGVLIALAPAPVVTPSPEAVPTNSLNASEDESGMVPLATQCSVSSSGTAMPGSVSASPNAERSASLPPKIDVGPGTSDASKSVRLPADSQTPAANSRESSVPFANMGTAAGQCAPPGGSQASAARPTGDTPAVTALLANESQWVEFSSSAKPEPFLLASIAEPSIAPNGAGTRPHDAPAPPVLHATAAASQFALTSQPATTTQDEIPQNENETPQNGAVPVSSSPGNGHSAAHVTLVPGSWTGSQDNSTAAAGTVSPSSMSLSPARPIVLHQPTSFANPSAGSATASGASVHVSSGISFFEARNAKASATDAAKPSFADSTQQGTSQAPAVATSSKNSQSNTNGGNASGDSQHKNTSINSSSPSASSGPTAASPLSVDTSQPSPIAPLVTATAGPQPASGDLSRPEASPRFREPVLNTPIETSHGTLAPGPVQMAQMVNRAAQAEMRIGMNTAEFGSVEVRTVVHANDVGVLIGSERGDLRTLLATEIPGIANTLQQQNLRLTQVNFHQQGFAFTGNSSGGGNSQPGPFPAKPYAFTHSTPEISPGSTQIEAPGNSPASGLSVLA